MPIRFTKFHGYGNDYLVIEAAELGEITDLNQFAREICERHYGAGADGIAVVSLAEDEYADFRVRIFNPDGSEAGMSGNGTRCAASYLFYHDLWSDKLLRLQTRKGLKRYHLLERSGNGSFLFRSELGQPRFDSVSIPFQTDQPLERVIDYPLEVGGTILKVTALQMGNPNCCVFVDDFEAIDWRRLGPLIENYPQFTERTNSNKDYVRPFGELRMILDQRAEPSPINRFKVINKNTAIWITHLQRRNLESFIADDKRIITHAVKRLPGHHRD